MIQSPYLLFLGDAPDIATAKTAAGIRQWRPELCAGQLRLPGCRVDLGLPDLTPAEAAARGIRTLIIGIANDGGFIAPSWVSAIVSALEAGLDVASGLHEPLDGVPQIAAAAKRSGRHLIEVRQPAQSFMPGTGKKRSWQAAAHRRNRLRGRQEVHGARDREGIARARRRCRFPRDGPDGNLHFRPRHRCRLGRVGFRLRRSRMAVTACRTAALGRDRGPGLAVPPGLRGRDAWPHPRQPARRDGALPRPGAHAALRTTRVMQSRPTRNASTPISLRRD